MNLYCFNGNNPLINKDLYGERIDITQEFKWDMDDYYQEAYRHDFQYAWHPCNYNNQNYSSSTEYYDKTESLFSNERIDLLRTTANFISNMYIGAYEGAFEGFYKPFGYSMPGPNSQAGYYGRVVGQKTMKALGLLQIAQGTSEIVTGLGGFGVSLGAEFASLGVVSGVAIPVAGVSVGLIASGAAKVGIGVVLYRNSSNNIGSKEIYKKSKSNISGKEGSKDVPSWSKGNRPYKGESGKDFAKRLLDEKYGKGNYKKGPKSDFNKIKKWGDRAFE